MSNKAAYLWLVLLVFSGIAFSGDRMGNGGDIRRFRVKRALRDLSWSSSVFEEFRESPECRDLVDARFDQIYPQFDRAGKLLSFADAQWFYAADFPTDRQPTECMRYALPGETRSGNLEYSFFYENCPRTYSRVSFLEHLLLPIRDRIYPEYSTADLAAIFDLLITNTNLCAYRKYKSRLPSDEMNFTAIRPESWQDPATITRLIGEARSVITKNLELRLKNQNQGCGNYCFPPVITIPGRLESGFPDVRTFSYSDILADLRSTEFSPNPTLDSCAQTEPQSGKTIYFNPTVCGMVTDTLDLAWILAHETAHHFGIRDESVADYFAADLVAMGARR